jgi:hypothetical protein
VSEYETSTYDYPAEIESPRSQRGTKKVKSKNVGTTPPRLWPALAGVFLICAVALSALQGVTFMSFLFSLASSIFVVIGLFVDRSRAASPSYSLEPWFNKISPVLYLASVVVAITQIILVAYEAAK